MTQLGKSVSSSVFNEMKQLAIELWQTYDDTYGYASGKINRIKDLECSNYNFGLIFSMFDIFNQQKILDKASLSLKFALYHYIKQ